MTWDCTALASFILSPGLSPHSSWLPVVRFIEEQFEQYLRDESGLNRKNIQDSRVHCCLYFISPFGRGSGEHPGGGLVGEAGENSVLEAESWPINP